MPGGIRHQRSASHGEANSVDPLGVERATKEIGDPVEADLDVLLGVVDLQEIREIMFDRELYDEIKVHEFMTLPQGVLDSQTKMEKVLIHKIYLVGHRFLYLMMR